MTFIGIDTGGTFTDLVLLDDGRLRVHKVLSTPDAPERAILEGIRELGLEPTGLRVIHGSTVATNAALEGKGVRTVYIGNRGLGDLLTIGRQARRELYDLQPEAVAPPVPPELCLETGARLGADGSIVEPLSTADLAELRRRLEQLAPEAVAVNLLFSYLDDTAERRIEAIVQEGVFVSRSSEVLPLVGEYERGIATWLNAWLGPLVEGYLRRLTEALPGARIGVMQSSGEAIAANQAGRQALRMLFSGPAGGLVGARFVGRRAGCDRLLSFDMGGTSTDVALLDGDPRVSGGGHIGPWPVAAPMVDMHTIGAGGGSTARMDAGGMLLVGPESAGADPGPACYARGGVQATVTDANLVLGRLSAGEFLGGRMPLDNAAASVAMGRIADALELSPEQAALGVIRVANEHMARALRVISVQRGVDPRGFILVSFGGAGGMHVCALADALDMRRAMVPVQAGVLSALGMLAARPGRRLSRTWLGLLRERSAEQVWIHLEELAAEGRAALRREGVSEPGIGVDFSLDLRYRGQSYTLNLPWSGGLADTEQAFSQRHEQDYGHRLDLPVELVNLCAAVHAPSPTLELDGAVSGHVPEPMRHETVFGLDAPVPVYRRDALVRGFRIEGPAILAETVATTWLAPNWHCEVDDTGNLMLYRAA